MAEQSLCSIPECGKPRFVKGWCRAHYLRWHRHGDPTSGGVMRIPVGETCSIEGCQRKASTRQLCGPHYHRLRKYGDPLAKPITHGEARKYLHEVVIPYTGHECLIWPFRCGEDGYARVDDPKSELVHRIVCTKVNGPAPTPDYDAAHSCGRGKQGCVAPPHLAWKTRAGNEADKVAHGTSNRGERNGHAKLSEDQVREIRASTESTGALAKRFGVTHGMIGHIRHRRAWKWLP